LLGFNSSRNRNKSRLKCDFLFIEYLQPYYLAQRVDSSDHGGELAKRKVFASWRLSVRL
jgi:hypothetical protein